MDRPLSRQAFERASGCIPGGVNSPVRSFASVATPPLVVDRGEGAHLFDLDGNRYIDLLQCWGALIHGHAHPTVGAAVKAAVDRGSGYGLSCRAEAELAERITDAFPSMERVRLVNSGTEAVMSAVRLARGCTGRNKVLVFEGCYHGHSDGLLASGGSGLSTLSIPRSAGVPRSVVEHTLVARYNDLASAQELAALASDDLAAVLGLRSLCDRAGALLIFDEVITGFRVGWGGAQGRFGVRPDLTTLGKIIGGGLPVGAFGGPAAVMEHLAPLGDVYQAGTLSGNPAVVAAGVAALDLLREQNPYGRLEQLACTLADGLAVAAADLGLPLQVNRCGSMFTVFFTDRPVVDYAFAKAADALRFGQFFRELLDRGILIPPSPFEAAFLSTAHREEHIRNILHAAREAMEAVLAEVSSERQHRR